MHIYTVYCIQYIYIFIRKISLLSLEERTVGVIITKILYARFYRAIQQRIHHSPYPNYDSYLTMKNQSMDRGGSDALRTHLEPAAQMEVRQTRRGWLMELCCPCEARTEMKYFVNGQQFATSLEESNCFCRMCCKIIHPFTMTVKELTTEAEIMKVERPLRCAPGKSIDSSFCYPCFHSQENCTNSFAQS